MSVIIHLYLPVLENITASLFPIFRGGINQLKVDKHPSERVVLESASWRDNEEVGVWCAGANDADLY